MRSYNLKKLKILENSLINKSYLRSKLNCLFKTNNKN